MKRDASGRPVADTEEDKQKQGDSKKNSDGSQSPQAPLQAPQETDRGQKGRNSQQEDKEISQDDNE